MENKYNDGIVIEAGVLESYNGNQSILIVPNGVTGVAMCAMMGNRTIHEVRLPDTVSLIDDAAFCNCDNLERIILSNGLLRIGKDVFFGCLHLREISFPNTLMHIGEYAFSHCDSLKSIYIPKKTNEIAPGAFSACRELTHIMVDDESESFVAINNHLYDILERKLLAVPGNVSDVCVSKSTEEIADFVYAHCYNLKTAIIPNHVRNIGKEAFASCPNLQRVVIESGVEAIGKHAFSNCGTLKHVVIPATVSFIGEHAFKDCGSKLVIDTPYNTYAWNYAKKSGISLVQKEPLHNGKVNCDNVYQILEDIHNMVSQTNSRTVRIEDKLDGLVDYIENDLNSFIASKKLRHEPTDKDEKDVSEFVESTAAYINQTMASPDVLVEHETKHLQLLFGKSWDRLLPTSRTSLVSAGVLWKSCASITKDNFDFSGVCISATSALEAELKRVFYTGFQNFLEARYGKPDANNWESTFVNWPEKLLSCTRYDFKKSLDKYSRGDQKWKPTIEKGNSFTMGVLPFIFGKPEKFRNPDQERLLHTRLMEYLSTIVAEAYVNNPLEAFYKQKDKGCFVEKSECVRKDYRNKAAHVDVVSRDQAEGCYQQVIGKMDAYEYTSDVTGLIMELYDRLR